MAKFLISIVGGLRPFVLASAFSLLALHPGNAKPKSQCNVLTDKTQCEALKGGEINLCQWIDMSNSYTVNGPRKSYCRLSGKSITKEQYEALKTASTPKAQ
jgi:hypothetical protein